LHIAQQCAGATGLRALKPVEHQSDHGDIVAEFDLRFPARKKQAGVCSSCLADGGYVNWRRLDSSKLFLQWNLLQIHIMPSKFVLLFNF
jgi:hypothetical protein